MKQVMKPSAIFFLIAILFNVLISAQPTSDSLSTDGNTMIVRVLNVSSDEGKIMLALCNSKENYESGDEFRNTEIEITNGIAEYSFENLPLGEYVIKCYHDENSNGRMDTNMMGIPKEDYAFSNNAMGTFGPASYEDARFQFKVTNQIVEIHL